MYTSTIAVLFAALTATSTASKLYLSDFTAEDFRLQPQHHTVSFDVSSKENAASPAHCTVSWTDSAPNCLTKCEGGEYYARVSEYEGAGNFQLNVREKGSHRNKRGIEGKYHVLAGQDDYFCSRGGQSTICSFTTEDSSVSFLAGRGPVDPCQGLCK